MDSRPFPWLARETPARPPARKADQKLGKKRGCVYGLCVRVLPPRRGRIPAAAYGWLLGASARAGGRRFGADFLCWPWGSVGGEPSGTPEGRGGQFQWRPFPRDLYTHTRGGQGGAPRQPARSRSPEGHRKALICGSPLSRFKYENDHFGARRVSWAHWRSPELEKSDFPFSSESGPLLIRFCYENDHFGARRV